MINIVHSLFQRQTLRRNTAGLRKAFAFMPVFAVLAPVSPYGASAAHLPVAHGIGVSGAVSPAGRRGIICDPDVDCPGRRPPGDPDRDARPFEGTLGRPCAYRWRFEPSGKRRYRVCY